MYDFAFDHRSLQREFRRSDFYAVPNLNHAEFRSSIVDRAVTQAASGFTQFSLAHSNVRGRDLYQLSQVSHDLVLRKLARNVASLTRTRQSDRGTIVRSMRALFTEGHDFRVYKLDLSKFYASVDRSFIVELFERDAGFPPASLAVLRAFHSALTTRNIPGLPQGLSISATLAEYLMRHFDRTIKSETYVYYYARFVDDILIVTTATETAREFLQKVRRLLPRGLELNHAKSRYFELDRQRVANPNASTPEQKIDFLGYQFTIYGKARIDHGQTRKVIVDIAPKKVARIKHRVCLSALQYLNDNDYSSFRDRLKILSGNYNMYDYDKRMRRNVGIFWNYREIDASGSLAISDLDSFLRKFLLSRTGRICGRLWPILSDIQRRELLSIRFSRSFSETSFHHFNARRLAELVACWAYE